MTRNAQPPANTRTPAADTRQDVGRHGLTESQDPQAAARRATQASDGPTRSEHEVRVRSNYETALGDVAAAADADPRKDPESGP